MKRYSLKTKDDVEIRFKNEEHYEQVKAAYLADGKVDIDGQLIERHHNPTFRVIGDDAPLAIDSQSYRRDPPVDRVEAAWKADVLLYSLRRTSAKKKPFYTYWHYKAARLIAKSWDIADTIKVLESESFDVISEDARGLEQYHKETDRRPFTTSLACSDCVNGWIIDPITKTARMCSCNLGGVDMVKEYALSHRHLF